MKNIVVALVLAVACLGTSQAQKFGYVNTTLLLQEMPEVQAVGTELETFQNQLMADGQAQVDAFEKSYVDYMTKVNNGELSKLQMAEIEQQLGKEQQAIQALEQQVQTKIMQKREELMGPILSKVDVAIKEVGKEGGYTFIFDSSLQGALLYAPDGDDLINLVQQKLQSN